MNKDIWIVLGCCTSLYIYLTHKKEGINISLIPLALAAGALWPLTWIYLTIERITNDKH